MPPIESRQNSQIIGDNILSAFSTLGSLKVNMASNNTVVPQTQATPNTSSKPVKPDPMSALGIPNDDTASVASTMASSVNSGRRRRRRGRKNKSTTANHQSLQQPTVLTRIQESKPPRLQLGLNLDVELELKARLQGDLSLALV